MRIKIVFLCITLLVLGCAKNQKKFDQHEVDKIIKNGMKRIILKDINGANKIFQQLVMDAPKNPEAYYYLGMINLEHKKVDEAFINFRNVLEIDPEFDLGENMELFYIRYCFTNKGDYISVEKETDKFIRLYPNHSMRSKLMLIVADSYRNDSKFDEAVKYYKRVIAMFPDSNNPDNKTATSMAKFIEQYSDHNREPLKLFAAAKKKHLPDESLDLFREIIAKYPDSRIIPLTKLEIAICFDHGRMNLFDSALVYYMQLVKEYPDTEFAELGEKNMQRIIDIYGQKNLLTGAHLQAYNDIMKKKK